MSVEIEKEARALYRDVYAKVAARRSDRVTKPEDFEAPNFVAHPIASQAYADYLSLFTATTGPDS